MRRSPQRAAVLPASQCGTSCHGCRPTCLCGTPWCNTSWHYLCDTPWCSTSCHGCRRAYLRGTPWHGCGRASNSICTPTAMACTSPAGLCRCGNSCCWSSLSSAGADVVVTVGAGVVVVKAGVGGGGGVDGGWVSGRGGVRTATCISRGRGSRTASAHTRPTGFPVGPPRAEAPRITGLCHALRMHYHLCSCTRFSTCPISTLRARTPCRSTCTRLRTCLNTSPPAC